MADDKHAYCIMAHGNWAQLQLLLNVLDDERNDIYLHIDVKSLNDFKKSGGVKTRYSGLIITESIDVRWSDISLADAEMCLFKNVVDSGNNYSRVHLISGVDFPLLSQNKIHDFFRNRNEEFIDIRTPQQFIKRLKYYHFFVRYRRNRPFVDFARRILIVLQIPFINRLASAPLKYAYGSEWCSLTNDAVKFIVDKWPYVRYMFKHTTCCDEHYKQMILLSANNFKFNDKGCLRYIVFTKGNPSPKTLTMADYDNIMSSGCLFARKFDVNVDKEVIDKLISTISK